MKKNIIILMLLIVICVMADSSTSYADAGRHNKKFKVIRVIKKPMPMQVPNYIRIVK